MGLGVETRESEDDDADAPIMGDGPGLLVAAENSERGLSAFKLSDGSDKMSSMLLLAAAAAGDACELLSPGLGVLFA